MAAKLRVGDRVQVLAGREKGRVGEITRMLRKEGRAIVANLNMVVRHRRDRPGVPGGRTSKEAPIHLSNLALLDPSSSRPTRVGFRIEEVDGRRRRTRVARRSGEAIDG